MFQASEVVCCIQLIPTISISFVKYKLAWGVGLDSHLYHIQLFALLPTQFIYVGALNALWKPSFMVHLSLNKVFTRIDWN
jgi:hypothetical protein